MLAPAGQAGATTPRISISPETAARIGRKLWQNECGGTVAGLTSWNAGEAFASLGIGHFIWYPPGRKGPYHESFPELAAFLRARGVRVPRWIPGDGCPWPDRASFLRAKDSPRMRELRNLLANTTGLQAEFAAIRCEKSLPHILRAAPPRQRGIIGTRFRALAATGSGLYCLVDYVNFKGDGTNPAERYRGVGWGLLQVLQEMRGQPSPQAAPAEFAAAARRVLDRRIRLAPRDESRWRAGWFNRCATYARGL